MTKREELEREIEELEEKLSQEENEYSSIQSQIDELEDKQYAVNDRCSYLENQIDKIKRKLEWLTDEELNEIVEEEVIVAEGQISLFDEDEVA